MPEIARIRPPEDADERGTLTGLLDFLRATVELKLTGLTEQQAFARPVTPSALTPAGVVKHLTGVERFWFAIDFAGQDVEWPWTDEDPHGCFPLAPDDTVAGLLAAYRTECARSRRIIAAASFDDIARSEGMTFNLRYAVAHLIEETARHLGHLDLLRESTDGEVGE
ncbi:DinB family protein [Kribbella sp. NPDC048928]|uniref:DinB family protein n=1 Tax=Kribbella sp. NPDC048928 TaxID=3364111 RepID=UPI00371EAA96